MLNHRPGMTTVLLAMGTTAAAGLPVFLISALFIQIADDTDAPLTALGALVAAYWLAAAAVAPMSGMLANAIGSRNLAVLSVTLAVISLAGASLWVPTWYWLFPWALLGGAANATSQPAVNHLLALNVSPKHRALAFGLKQSAIPLAVVGAGLAVPVLALTFGWRSAFIVSMVLGCVILLAYVAVAPSRRGKNKAKSKRVPVTLGRQLTIRLLLVTCASALASSAMIVAIAFTVTSAVHRGFEPAFAGILLSVGSLLAVAARILVGILTDRGLGGSLHSIGIMFLGGAVGLILMALPSDWTFVLGFLIATGIGWGWGGLLQYVVSQMSGPATPAGTGLVLGGNFLGNTVAPLIFGIVYAGVGDVPLWIGLAIMMLVAGVITFWIGGKPPIPVPSENRTTLP